MNQPPDPYWPARDDSGQPFDPALPEAEPDQPAGYGPAAPAGYGYGEPAEPGLAAGPAPILLSFAPPGRQRRLVTAFRLILTIPHGIVLWALGVATEFIVIIGWFAALFTGRLPEWASTFITGVLRWQARVYSYEYFLTDAYPPFAMEDEPYPVRLAARPTRLNRLAVFFRLFLLLPAAVVAAVSSLGLAYLSFFCWLIALVAGRLPAALHQAIAAVARYQIRYAGFAFMVTSEYPWGLFGDRVQPTQPQPAGMPVTPTTLPGSGPGTGTDDVSGMSAALGGGSALAIGSAAEPAADPWRLTLSGAARGLVSLFLAVGVAATVAEVVLIVTVAGSAATNSTNAAALASVGQANTALNKSLTRFPSQVQACGGQLTCVTSLDRNLAGSLHKFATSVQSANFAGSAASDVGSVVRDANAAAQSLDQLGSATSVAQYQSYAAGTKLGQQLNQMDTNLLKLLKDAGAG